MPTPASSREDILANVVASFISSNEERRAARELALFKASTENTLVELQKEVHAIRQQSLAQDANGSSSAQEELAAKVESLSNHQEKKIEDIDVSIAQIEQRIEDESKALRDQLSDLSSRFDASQEAWRLELAERGAPSDDRVMSKDIARLDNAVRANLDEISSLRAIISLNSPDEELREEVGQVLQKRFQEQTAVMEEMEARLLRTVREIREELRGLSRRGSGDLGLTQEELQALKALLRGKGAMPLVSDDPRPYASESSGAQRTQHSSGSSTIQNDDQDNSGRQPWGGGRATGSRKPLLQSVRAREFAKYVRAATKHYIDSRPKSDRKFILEFIEDIPDIGWKAYMQEQLIKAYPGMVHRSKSTRKNRKVDIAFRSGLKWDHVVGVINRMRDGTVPHYLK